MKNISLESKRLNILGNCRTLSNREILTAALKSWRLFSILAALPAIIVSNAHETRADNAIKPEANGAELTESRLEKLMRRRSKPELLKRRGEYRLPHQKGGFNIVDVLAGSDNCPGTPIPRGTYTAASPFTDSGNTTGANDTVTRAYLYSYTYYNYDTFGPDNIYSFTITARGANPKIEVSTTSGTYRPLIYILDSRYSPQCPAGTANHAYNELVLSDSRWGTGNTADIGSWAWTYNHIPFNVPLYVVVDSRNNDVAGSGPYTLRIQDLTLAGAPIASVSGRVLTPDGRSLRNAVVTITDSAGITRTATSSSFGLYRFDNVLASEIYTLTVRSRRYRFSPRTLTVNDNLTDFDLVGLE